MDLKNLFLINAVIALLYGIVLVVIPAQFLGLYGISLDAGAQLVSQLFGASLVAIGLITWFARDAGPSDARDAIVQALLWTDGLGAVLAALGTVAGATNALGWSSVVIYALLAAGYGYHWYGAREPAAT